MIDMINQMKLAAKGAGYDLTQNHIGSSTFLMLDDFEWNPVFCDGDSFRLVVDCNIEIEQFAGEYTMAYMGALSSGRVYWADHNGDKRLATRLAVLRVASQHGMTVGK